MAKNKYTTEFPQLVEMYLREGMTEAQAAKKLGVSVATFETYKNRYLEFLEAIKRGKAPVDFEVENALLKRALGYKVDDIHVSNYMGDVTITPIIKVYPPDVTAAIFWLKNRQPARWRDVKGVELTGKDGGAVVQEVAVSAPEIAKAVQELAKTFL
ncbi:MAG: hypothetical protein HGA87_00110 [Desulfobulbaceae bacterium]|nr:hypothetical protein [Desulfobulbaceae bacterium]